MKMNMLIYLLRRNIKRHSSQIHFAVLIDFRKNEK